MKGYLSGFGISLILAFVFYWLPIEMLVKSIVYALALLGLMMWMAPSSKLLALMEKPFVSSPPVHESHTNTVNFVQAVKTQATAPRQPTTPLRDEATMTPTQASKVTFYQQEAHALTHIMRDIHGLPARIDYMHKDSIKMAWGIVVYQVTDLGGLRYDRLQSITDDLAREINALHRKDKYGDVTIMAQNSQPKLTLQVTRAKQEPLLWDSRPLVGKPLTTCLGKYMMGINEHNLILDIDGMQSSWMHGLFIGLSGSGKSRNMDLGLIGLLDSTGPDKLEIYGIDLHGTMFDSYESLPHVAKVARSVDDALDILSQFAAWVEVHNAPQDNKVRLLVIDEVQILTTDPVHDDVVLEKLKAILQRGRKYGLRVWMSVQNPDRFNFPPELKAITQFISCGHITLDDYVRRQLHIYDTNKLAERGEQIVVGVGTTARVTSFWLPDDEREDEIVRLKRKWGEKRVEDAPVVVDSETIGVKFPIQNRALLPSERREICRMATDQQYFYRGKLSLNRLIGDVYSGDKNAAKMEWIKDALREGGVKFEERGV